MQLRRTQLEQIRDGPRSASKPNNPPIVLTQSGLILAGARPQPDDLRHVSEAPLSEPPATRE